MLNGIFFIILAFEENGKPEIQNCKKNLFHGSLGYSCALQGTWSKKYIA